MAMTAKKQIFCANCQAQTEHDCSVDKNGELLCLCVCGRFLKAPLFDHPDKLVAFFAAHHKENAGQVQTDTSAAEQAKYDDQFKKLMGIV